MNYRYILPCRELKEYVEYYLIIESTGGENIEPVIVYPKPQAEMVFNYSGKTIEQIGTNNAMESTNWGVSGFFTNKTTYYTQGQLGVIMVGFKPWGIQSFINFQTQEITNTNLDLKLVYPSEMRLIEERLLQCDNTLSRIQIIEEFLLSILIQKINDGLIISALQTISQMNGDVKISRLSKEFCLSEKQFVRRFKSVIGINPKFFARLLRYQYILKILDSGKLDLLDHAIECGFYDVSHFIHEFTEFTGMSPSVYVNEKVRTDLGVYFDKNIEQSPYYHLIYQ